MALHQTDDPHRRLDREDVVEQQEHDAEQRARERGRPAGRPGDATPQADRPHDECESEAAHDHIDDSQKGLLHAWYRTVMTEGVDLFDREGSTWQERLDLIVETMRAISRETNPHDMVAAYSERMRWMRMGRVISLSRRGVEPPKFVPKSLS